MSVSVSAPGMRDGHVIRRPEAEGPRETIVWRPPQFGSVAMLCSGLCGVFGGGWARLRLYGSAHRKRNQRRVSVFYKQISQEIYLCER